MSMAMVKTSVSLFVVPTPSGGGYGVSCYGNIIKETPSFFKDKNKTAHRAVLEHLVRGAPTIAGAAPV